MDKNKLIKHLQNDIYCRIGVSKIAGVGVICVKDIPKGVNPFKSLSNEKSKIIQLKDSDLTNVDKNVVKMLKDFFGHDDTYDVLYAGPNHLDASFYLNHSDNPNLDIVAMKGSEYLEFITNRVIKKGDELVINYGKYGDF